MSTHNISICAIAKNEGRYIVEWLAFHKAIGFNHIFLYDNDSDDATIKNAGGFLSSGFVTVVPWASLGRSNPQREAYAHFACNFANASDWIIFLDIDEFINLKVHSTIREFLESYASPAVALNWKMFGSSGHDTYRPGLLMDRFTEASETNFEPNSQVKTFVRPQFMEAIDIHNPKLIERHVAVMPSGNPANLFPSASSPSTEHDLVQINHYFVKSREEWTIKRNRGKADYPLGHGDRLRNDGEFGFYDRNDETDVSIQKFRDKLIKTMREYANKQVLDDLYSIG